MATSDPAADVPALYGDTALEIKVDQQQMFTSATVTIPKYIDTVADSINKIVNVWNDLRGNWLGATADEAQAFDDSWSSSIKSLFGDQKEDSGILTRVADAVLIAAENYEDTEKAMLKMFTDFNNQISSASSGSSTSDFNRDHNEGPIWESGNG